VPSDDGFGRDDEERLFPARPTSTDQQPEELAEQIQLWAWMVPLEHDELSTKRQILKNKTGMRAKESKERSKAESKGTRHIGGLWQNDHGDDCGYVNDSKVDQSLGERQPVPLRLIIIFTAF